MKILSLLEFSQKVQKQHKNEQRDFNVHAQLKEPVVLFSLVKQYTVSTSGVEMHSTVTRYIRVRNVCRLAARVRIMSSKRGDKQQVERRIDKRTLVVGG